MLFDDVQLLFFDDVSDVERRAAAVRALVGLEVVRVDGEMLRQSLASCWRWSRLRAGSNASATRSHPHLHYSSDWPGHLWSLTLQQAERVALVLVGDMAEAETWAAVMSKGVSYRLSGADGQRSERSVKASRSEARDRNRNGLAR
ncbi:MAG: hypothetical protein DI536_12905 [Archangium gephyra]|uniref:Uncharacterized protein n=1 Tax=Archangium gephyra TaxID=48 RepID=A0A2W5TPD8_9BACT|nr:MAG: hypothetical protein DI536_12905 [Archangium gephyra]